jgi:hypothetical protein
MAEQINSKFSAQQQQQQNQRKSEIFMNGAKSSNESVDLDNLFAFLSEVTPNGPNSNQIINEIGEKMNHLVEDLDVELESVIQQEIEGLTNEKNIAKSQQQIVQPAPKPTPVPPQQKPATPNHIQVNHMPQPQQSTLQQPQTINSHHQQPQISQLNHPITQQQHQPQSSPLMTQQNKMG